MHHFVFKQMNSQDIPIFIDEMFNILAGNMGKIAPTGNSYEEDKKAWSSCAIPAYMEAKELVILILDEDKLCGFFQYSLDEMTFHMEELQFKPEYHGSGLFSEFFHYLTTIVPAHTKYVDAYTHKQNLKIQGILNHLGLEATGESKNGNMYHFEGEYRKILEHFA